MQKGYATYINSAMGLHNRFIESFNSLSPRVSTCHLDSQLKDNGCSILAGIPWNGSNFPPLGNYGGDTRPKSNLLFKALQEFSGEAPLARVANGHES
ncbi:uncharacterized protein PGTG_22493 [Puccinia graminis f. sp. tritici CRL 75-36-700-3]|uniref:Uncharacterized protein n=1 Tax=Puccinia graminis f. sp. tritici (strain CRL 75-36-700-3 / race SCCL) TaxID=418459 RepID=H6QUM9_PUCGT|nr:uncharacterized protein PGTG_22493 [Puccinia graminis f. sp. tritici CRL 75-36-700-3]EHS64741.1 hypothetical protein PGTG_22493 [Puccinia graminis f. sp. tritici CRL 75-36-700-3]